MTGVFTGTELHLWAEQPHYDERLPLRDDKPDLNFNEKRLVIKTDAEWQEVRLGDGDTTNPVFRHLD